MGTIKSGFPNSTVICFSGALGCWFGTHYPEVSFLISASLFTPLKRENLGNSPDLPLIFAFSSSYMEKTQPKEKLL